MTFHAKLLVTSLPCALPLTIFWGRLAVKLQDGSFAKPLGLVDLRKTQLHSSEQDHDCKNIEDNLQVPKAAILPLQLP